MARFELELGALVQFAGAQFAGLETGHMATEVSYRIEQLLMLDDGATLYRIRCDAEPFDHVVSARQLARVINSSQA